MITYSNFKAKCKDIWDDTCETFHEATPFNLPIHFIRGTALLLKGLVTKKDEMPRRCDDLDKNFATFTWGTIAALTALSMLVCPIKDSKVNEKTVVTPNPKRFTVTVSPQDAYYMYESSQNNR